MYLFVLGNPNVPRAVRSCLFLPLDRGYRRRLCNPWHDPPAFWGSRRNPPVV